MLDVLNRQITISLKVGGKISCSFFFYFLRPLMYKYVPVCLYFQKSQFNYTCCHCIPKCWKRLIKSVIFKTICIDNFVDIMGCHSSTVGIQDMIYNVLNSLSTEKVHFGLDMLTKWWERGGDRYRFNTPTFKIYFAHEI